MNEAIKTTTDTPVPIAFSLTEGLSEAEAERSVALHGSNHFTKRKKAGFFRKFLGNLNDPIIRILLGAMAVNILLMITDINWAETIGIGLTVFVSAFVSTVSEHSGGAAFERLYHELGDRTCLVIRGGKEREMGIGDIAVFDLVKLRAGETVPADGWLVAGHCSLDESALTGESRRVEKAPDAALMQKLRRGTVPFTAVPSQGSPTAVFRGSSVVSGDGLMLVCRVGDDTFCGAVAAELQSEEGISPLKMRLTHLARTISKIGYVIAVIIALIHLFDAFFLDAGMNPVVALERMKDPRFVASECLSAFTMAISVIVVAVPEGLPMMITVVLSSNMKRMAREHVLVKRPVGIETAGSLHILFTDKTGTLTTGNLRLSEVVTAEKAYFTRADLDAAPFHRDLLRDGDRLCASEEGNPTDLAIRRFLGERQRGTAEERIPFDSAYKYAAGLSKERFLIRGAPEYLLPRCTYALSKHGERIPMTDSLRQKLLSRIADGAKGSYRILLQATGRREDFTVLKQRGLRGVELTFHALFLLKDEIREHVPEAVADCKRAGMRVIMLTGDNGLTAAAIGLETGILSPHYRLFDPNTDRMEENGDLVITGAGLASLSDADVVRLLPRIAVISRVTPTDKSRLVKLARGAGYVVGMTGDGINDAPALKAADVGFAMGSGTEVAKEAADIVITDNNFVSVTKAVLFGRTIFASIRKFIVFQLTMNLSAVGVSLLGPLFGVDHPVTVIQLLWVNIIMDTLGSLAFAGEPALPEIMHRPPIARTDPLLTAAMVRQIVFSGVYTIGLCVFFLVSPRIHALFMGGEVYRLTVFFALFIFCGILTAFNTRTERINLLSNLGKNKAFLVIMPAVAVIQLLIIYFGGEAFRTVPLKPDELLLVALFAFTVVPADLLRKVLSRGDAK